LRTKELDQVVDHLDAEHRDQEADGVDDSQGGAHVLARRIPGVESGEPRRVADNGDEGARKVAERPPSPCSYQLAAIFIPTG